MNLNNLSMNYKIIFGISTITILILIFQYIKNLLNPKIKLIEPQITTSNDSVSNDVSKQDNSNIIDLIDKIDTSNIKLSESLDKIHTELSEFNHIYQERLFEKLIPSQMKKTIIHLSSIDHSNDGIGKYVFDLASTSNSGLRKFTNIINLRLLSAQIPFVPHNIYVGDGIHNILKFVDLPEITIPEGKYTINSLINKINNLLNDESLSITFNFDNNTHFISIKNETGSDITIDITYPLWKRLGIYEEIIISNGITYYSIHIPDISVHYIDIVSPDIHPKSSTLTTNNSTILKRFPFMSSMGSLIHYEVSHSDYISQEFFIPDTSSNLAKIEINLKRHDGTFYDLKKLHFDLKLEISELVEPTLLNELDSHMKRDRERFVEINENVEIGGFDYSFNN